MQVVHVIYSNVIKDFRCFYSVNICIFHVYVSSYMRDDFIKIWFIRWSDIVYYHDSIFFRSNCDGKSNKQVFKVYVVWFAVVQTHAKHRGKTPICHPDQRLMRWHPRCCMNVTKQ